MDESLTPRPQMVDTWTVSDDRLTWTFVLRDGLAWHDGPPVTAEDCVASLKRWGKRDGMGQKLMQYTASLEATDAQRSEEHTSELQPLMCHSYAAFCLKKK